MNIITDMKIIDSMTIIFKNENSAFVYSELGNGDIYLSALSNNDDYDFQLSKNILSPLLVDNINTKLKEYKVLNKSIESDELNSEKRFNLLRVQEEENSIIFSFSNNITNFNNSEWCTIALNTNCGKNKNASIGFAQLLWKLTGNFKHQDKVKCFLDK